MYPSDGRVVSNFLLQALRGEDITVYGEEQTRAFCPEEGAPSQARLVLTDSMTS
jgi:hypothetical protein